MPVGTLQFHKNGGIITPLDFSTHLGLAVRLLEEVPGDVRREYVVEQLVCVPELIDIIF